MRSNQTSRGFTLLELMVVVAIIGILASVAGVALIYGNGRARLNNTTFEMQSMANLAQMRAAATGRPVYLVFYEKGTEAGVATLERDERTGALAAPVWSAIDMTVDATTGGTIQDRIRFRTDGSGASTERAGLQWERLSTFSALPPPYSAIALTPSFGSGLLQACSFCVAGAGGSVHGAIRYAPDGTIRVATAPANLAGGVVGLSIKADRENSRARLLTISAPTGAVKIINKVSE